MALRAPRLPDLNHQDLVHRHLNFHYQGRLDLNHPNLNHHFSPNLHLNHFHHHYLDHNHHFNHFRRQPLYSINNLYLKVILI